MTSGDDLRALIEAVLVTGGGDPPVTIAERRRQAVPDAARRPGMLGFGLGWR